MAKRGPWGVVALGLLAALASGCGRPAPAYVPMQAKGGAKPGGALPQAMAAPGAQLSQGGTPTSATQLMPQGPSVSLLPGEAVEGELIVAFKQGGKHSLPGGTVRAALGVDNTFVVSVNRSAYRLQATAEAWDELPEVDYVEPNFTYAIANAPRFGNDPGAADAWGVPAIGAPRLWPLSVGMGPVVAVLDTGVAAHPDLAGRLLPGLDLVDNDNEANDPHGHGTHVAGIVGAAAGNGLGSAGVAPGATILPIRVLDAEGRGSNATIASGIREAVKRGAKIINLSLGGSEASETLKRAVADAQAAGVIVVAASGNEGVTTPFYPAAFDGVIAVGAHDQSGRRASFSNHGSYLSIAAPGVGIGSLGTDGGVRSLSGTSMASPHVAGAAALLSSSFPQLSAANLKHVFQKAGRATSGFEGGAVKALDAEAAFAAVGSLDLVPPSVVAGLSATATIPGEAQLRWQAASDNRGVAFYRIRRNGQSVGESQTTSFLDRGVVGTARFSVQAVDADGNAGPWSQELSVVGAAASPSFEAVKVERGKDFLVLRWKTKTALRCCVQWGTSSQLGNNSPWETSPSTEHSVRLEGLKRFTLHHYRLVAADAQSQLQHTDLAKARTKLWWLFQAQ